MEFNSAGGITGLKIRRSDAETVLTGQIDLHAPQPQIQLQEQLHEQEHLQINTHTTFPVSPIKNSYNSKTRTHSKTKFPGQAGFNWFKEIRSVDTRKGITSSKDQPIFLVQASKHGKHIKNNQNNTDTDAKSYADTQTDSAEEDADDIANTTSGIVKKKKTEKNFNNDEINNENDNDDDSFAEIAPILLIEKLSHAFDEKEGRRSTINMGTGHLKSVSMIPSTINHEQ